MNKPVSIYLITFLLLFTFSACYERPTADRSSRTENAEGDDRSERTDRSGSFEDVSALGEDAADNTTLDTDGTAVVDTAKKVPFHTKLNLYIENSGSMNGYVNGNTTFKNALGDLLVYLKYEFGEQNIHLHFINDTIHPIEFDRDITQFAASLTPETMRVGNTASSDLNLIFNKTQKRTPIAAMILSHAALQADRYIPMHNIAKQTIMMTLLDVLIFGININAAPKTR